LRKFNFIIKKLYWISAVHKLGIMI